LRQDKLVTVIGEIESNLVPRVRAAAAHLANRFPATKVNVEGHTYRDGDAYELAISCLLPDSRPDGADLVELEVGFINLRTSATIQCADVVWGADSGGGIEAEVFPTPVTVTPATWDELEAAIPRLIEALAEAIGRGHPPRQTDSASE
jgi:hypothetical protein